MNREILQCDLSPEPLARNLICLVQQVLVEATVVHQRDDRNQKRQEMTRTMPPTPTVQLSSTTRVASCHCRVQEELFEKSLQSS